MQNYSFKTSKGEILKNMMRRPETSKLIREALSSPLGSTSRIKARKIFSIMNKLNSSYDGLGGPGIMYNQIQQPEMDPVHIPTDNSKGMIIFHKIPKPKITYGNKASKYTPRAGSFDGSGGPGAHDGKGGIFDAFNIFQNTVSSFNADKQRAAEEAARARQESGTKTLGNIMSGIGNWWKNVSNVEKPTDYTNYTPPVVYGDSFSPNIGGFNIPIPQILSQPTGTSKSPAPIQSSQKSTSSSLPVSYAPSFSSTPSFSSIKKVTPTTTIGQFTPAPGIIEGPKTTDITDPYAENWKKYKNLTGTTGGTTGGTTPKKGYGGEIAPSISNKIIKDLTPQELQLLQDAQEKREGSTLESNALGIKVGDLTQHWIDEGKARIGVQAKDGGYFLVFDSKATEKAAYKELLNSPLYANLTVDAGMRLWSGADEPDTNEKLSDSGDGNKEPEPELTGLAKKAYDAVKGNMGAGMFALKNNPLLGGEELKKSLWDKFNIDDQQQDILKMKTANLSLPKDVTAYIKSRDEYIKKTDQEIDRFIDESMNTTDMSNPNNIANANAQLNYLYILRGRQNQSYIAFLDEAVNQHQANLDTMVNEYTVSLDAYNKAIESGQANYDKMSAALSDMYTEVQNAPVREQTSRAMEAQIKATLGGIASDSAKLTSQQEFTPQYQELKKVDFVDSNGLAKLGTDLVNYVYESMQLNPSILPVNIIHTYTKGVNDYLAAGEEKSDTTGTTVTSAGKFQMVKEAIKNFANFYNVSSDSNSEVYNPNTALLSMDSLDKFTNKLASMYAENVKEDKALAIMEAIKSLAPSGFLGIGKGTPATQEEFVENVIDETGDPLDESIAKAIYAVYLRYVEGSKATKDTPAIPTMSPTEAKNALLYPTSSSSDWTDTSEYNPNTPLTPAQFAINLGNIYASDMKYRALNSQ